jgi:hypothetical protein
MKLGKLEKKILAALELPYPEEYGVPGYSYPIHGSNTETLVRLIFGSQALEFNRYICGSSQASISRALNSLHKKELVCCLKPKWKRSRSGIYRVDERLIKPGTHKLWFDKGQEYEFITKYPHNTKAWWVLRKHLTEVNKGSPGVEAES